MIPNHGEPGRPVSEPAQCTTRRAPRAPIAALKFLLGLAIITQAAQAQTYRVIHNFGGEQDGAYPSTGLTIDNAGNMYGTTFGGGTADFGTVYSLDRQNGNWLLRPIYSFQAGSDGAGPVARLVIGSDGELYGSTAAGGGGPCLLENGYRGCGTVYKLRPPARAPVTVIYNWSSTILYRFSNDDGAYPQGELTFDGSGNIYGTAVNGGSAGWGLIYELVPSGDGWNQNILYQAQGDGDGAYPWGGVVFDSSGNLYGVFSQDGPDGYGALYQLTPSGSGWTEDTIHGFTFQGHDGAAPQGGLILDGSGNLFGSTVHDPNGGGDVFEMEPSGGGWSYNFLYGLSGGIGLGPYDKLTMDAAGNLYGTTYGDGQHGFGSVFKLTHSSGGWTYRSLHDFTGGSDGGNPMSRLVFDSDGNLYGTAIGGGANNKGVIFQITP